MVKTQQPDNLRYARTHEWVRVEGDLAYIGISDYAQYELGDVVYLDLPWDDSGQEMQSGDHFGDIESVKATSELFLPVGGTVEKVNAALQDHAELVNNEPYGEGWMLALRLSNPAEVEQLMDAASYTRFLESDAH